MEETRIYPIGIHDFEEIITRNLVYVDKTEYVYRMTHSGGKYFFLSRPRLFGKSLLVSTFKNYFQGKKDLFKGLAIEKLENEWTEYPVLHFSMAGGKHIEKDLFELIQTAYEKTGKQVVVLIDEYDAPMIDVMDDKEQWEAISNVLLNFYSPLKQCEPMLRFVFLTGITKFPQTSIYGILNNMVDISMDDNYAGICGITEKELETRLSADVDAFKLSFAETRKEKLESLQFAFGGYRFALQSPEIFNPYCLLDTFSTGKVKIRKFYCGEPALLLKMLEKYPMTLKEIKKCEVDKCEFDVSVDCMTSCLPFLYQFGYITIVAFDVETQLYTLDISNLEFRMEMARCPILNKSDE